MTTTTPHLLAVFYRAQKAQDTGIFEKHRYCETLDELLAVANYKHRLVIDCKRKKNIKHASDLRIHSRQIMDRATEIMNATISKGEHFDYNTFNAITEQCFKTIKLKT